MYTKLTQAHKRPLTGKERLGLFVFVLKFLLSKFGIFLFFVSLNTLGSRAWNQIPETSKAQLILSRTQPSQTSETQNRGVEGLCPGTPVEPCLNQVFSKFKLYCILATIVTVFLNPQQTKYFGGLAVALKQAGLFSKYGKSEKTVYVFSWIFILLFASMSYIEVLETFPVSPAGGKLSLPGG
jgi:hypothetical protein